MLWNPDIMIFHQNERLAHLSALRPLGGHVCVIRNRLLGDLKHISGTNILHLSENSRPSTNGSH